MINYIITPNVDRHTYSILLQFKAISNIHEIKLPVWIPGSYMIREFSKNIISFNAYQNKIDINAVQHNKNTWLLKNLILNKTVEVQYEVYAYDTGIRTAFLDYTRAYFNATSLCLFVKDIENVVHNITFKGIPNNWKVATALIKTSANIYIADNYLHLIDCPFTLGKFLELKFKVKNIPHRLILSGIIPNNFAKKKLLTDINKICEKQIDLFGGNAPFESYTFLLNLNGDVYTGLEHANSTALMAPYYSLPQIGTDEINEDYLNLLGLISHEYFHAWNVKRIKPKAFDPYDLEAENYTGLLWWFEGITSYYDDLILFRCGLIDQKRYLKLILDNINSVYKYDGVNNQTLRNSSLTSWIKYYKPDESSPNSNVSYYAKGAIVGLCLDLIIRNQSSNKKSLDDVMLELFEKWQYDKSGIDENQLTTLIQEYSGCDLTKEIELWTDSCIQIPIIQLLAKFGILLKSRSAQKYTEQGKIVKNDADSKNKLTKAIVIPTDLGCKLIKLDIGYKILNVYAKSAAYLAGLAVNDIIVAIDKIQLCDIERQLAYYKQNDTIELSFFRQEKLLNLKFCLSASPLQIYDLSIINPNKLKSWL